MPVVVLSAGHLPERYREKIGPKLAAAHELLASRSPRGKRVVLPDVSHQVPFEDPAAVVEAIRDVVDQVRT